MASATKMLASAGDRADDVHVPLTGGRLGLVTFARRLGAQIGEDHVGAFAGALTYSALLAIFPFLVFVLSLLGVFGAAHLLSSSLDQVSYAIPAEANKLLHTQIQRLTDPSKRSAFTFSAIVSALIALWGVSGAFRTIMDAMNVMYGVRETRGFVRRYVTSVAMSVGVALLFVFALVLVVGGTSIASYIAAHTAALGPVFVWTWSIAQWPVLVALVLFAFAAIYYVAPSAEQQFRFVTPGSVFAVALWLVFSLAFSLYVNNVGSYDATYGTLAGIVVMMLYLYYSSFVLLLGAEMNQVIEDANPQGKDAGEQRAGDAATTADTSSRRRRRAP